MKRAIVQPADVSGAPLDELKQWLGITRDAHDSELTGLLQTSLELCEAFTGQVPLEIQCEEPVAASKQWQPLSARPLRAITAMDEMAASGARIPLPANAYELDIDGDSNGSVRLKETVSSVQVIVSYVAGIADNWSALPSALKHGIIRLAAHHYLSRDKGDSDAPPVSVAALWRPWKQVRI